MIMETGTMNHINPSNILDIMKYDWVTTIKRVTWVQANCGNEDTQNDIEMLIDLRDLITNCYD